MHTEITIEDRFKRLEDKLVEIRKLSLGTLLLAKELWKDELRQKGEGSELIKAIDGGEEAHPLNFPQKTTLA